MTKKKIVYLLISLSILILGILLTRIYRPYVYANSINDFGFADIIGSLISVICFCFLLWTFTNPTNKQKNNQIILITFLYAILWEVAGLLDIHGTFDIKDVTAGLGSGIITYYTKNSVDKIAFLNNE